MTSSPSIEKDPSYYDLRGDLRPRKIYKAWGSKLASPKGSKKKKWRHMDAHINAPTLEIAQRVAKRHFALYKFKMDSCFEISWQEYGESLRRCGVQVSGI